ncbi:hypothetical protein PQX77_020620 [Marasmius sp. AFHP31]|nr:hypothetical protein PQX77_020620 [Marasmius sp. AFHP31]
MAFRFSSPSTTLSQKYGCRQREQRAHGLKLPYDILVYIFEKLEDDYKALFRCSLLNWEANHAAIPFLYRSVVFEPTYWYGYQGKAIGEQDSPNLWSACLSRHAVHVRHFEVRGYLSLSSSSRNRANLTRNISNAIKSFPNLRAVKFLPKSYYPDLFSESLQALSENACPYLTELTIDESSFTDKNIPAVLKIGGLRKLVIEYASTAVAETLREGWLDMSSETLTTLRFEGVCLPITADILNSQVHNLQNLEVFNLGLIEESNDPNLYAFLESLPRLHALSLYYNEEHFDNVEFGQPCRLSQLKSLTIRYFGPQSQNDIDKLCRWVHRIVAGSPLVEDLLLIDDNGESIHSFTQPSVVASFDLLVPYLATKRMNRLRRLQLPNGYLGRASLESVCSTCSHLEDLSVATSKASLMGFIRSSSSIRRRFSIKKAVFNLRRTVGMEDTDVSLSLAEATEVVQKLPNLREFTVNKAVWETSFNPGTVD